MVTRFDSDLLKTVLVGAFAVVLSLIARDCAVTAICLETCHASAECVAECGP